MDFLFHLQTAGVGAAFEYGAEQAAQEAQLYCGAPVPDWEVVDDVDELKYPPLF